MFVLCLSLKLCSTDLKGLTEIDSDLDGVSDCLDQCPGDATKTSLGTCGCGQLVPNNACPV